MAMKQYNTVIISTLIGIIIAIFIKNNMSFWCYIPIILLLIILYIRFKKEINIINNFNIILNYLSYYLDVSLYTLKDKDTSKYMEIIKELADSGFINIKDSNQIGDNNDNNIRR